MTIDVLNSEHSGNPSSAERVPGLWKSLVIVKALAAIPDELAASIRRANSNEPHESEPLPQDWVLPRDTSKAELERALLAIDIFPRCAVLLSVFEQMSVDDAAILLGADRELVFKARMTGLWELTGNLARVRVWAPTPSESYAIAGEIL